MIQSYRLNKKIYHFFDTKTIKENSNVFTVLVGKNGSGKSTLLKDIVISLRNHHRQQQKNLQESLFGQNLYSGIDIVNFPNKVIASSVSPFDKFPVLFKFNKIEKYDSFYKYLGVRGFASNNLGVFFMSNIIASLLESINREKSQLKEIVRVLSYLEYKEEFSISLVFNHSFYKILTDLFENGYTSFFSKILEIKYKIKETEFPNEYVKFNSYNILGEIENEIGYSRVMSLFNEIGNGNNSRNAEFRINENGIVGNDFVRDIEATILLLEYGVLRLKEFKMFKALNGTPVSLVDASSGEQSVILSVLGIASQIQENSIICIDEPEISLHPEWQEKYIELLINTFSNYKGCHFIIATHSPQIISKLEAENCYILAMETGDVKNARDFIKKSADFQLANIFDSPGFKNEYLSRIALNVFAKVSSKKRFDKEDLENYHTLERQNEFMDKNDPIKDLFNAIKELYKLYA